MNKDIDKRLLDYNEAKRPTHQIINAPVITNESLLQNGGNYNNSVADLVDFFMRKDKHSDK